MQTSKAPFTTSRRFLLLLHPPLQLHITTQYPYPSFLLEMCKILVLAGYGQSAELYRTFSHPLIVLLDPSLTLSPPIGGRLATLRAELSDTAELVFINPTHEMKIPTETGSFSGSYDTNEEWDDVHAPRCWWNAPEGGPEGDLRYRSCLHKEFDDTLHVRLLFRV